MSLNIKTIQDKLTAEEARILGAFHADKAKAELWIRSNRGVMIAVAAALVVGAVLGHFIR